ncbi:MAG: hypothetical protein ABEJ40_02665 [Haloarculaceae archaeon]
MHGRRSLAGVLAVVAVPAAVEPVAAHTGTTHAGTPHWLLFFATVAGVVVAAGGWRVLQSADRSPRLGGGLLFGGVLLAIFGSVGLVEIQIAPETTPAWTRWFPVVNAVAGVVLAVGGLVVGRLRYPERPRYAGLALLLAAWVSYPTLVPGEGLTNPLGYLLAAATPLAVGYVLATDAGDALPAAFTDRTAKLVGGVSFVLFSVFFAFSAGTLSVNPDVGPGVPDHGFVTVHSVASPLVYWPAVEFYVPAVPLAGYVSLGTLLLVGLLGGLVAVNAALAARQWAAAGAVDSPRGMLGAVAASGATACCCCAPALYGAVGVLFGTAASPVYWAFMDPTSPVGGLFFAASVLALTGSAIRASASPACRAGVPDRDPADPVV